MKNLIISASMAFSLTTMATVLSPDTGILKCSASTSQTSAKLRYMLEEQEHDFDVQEKMSSIIKSVGYDWLSVHEIITCSNENSRDVDFELLRKFTINSIAGRRIF